MLDLTQEEYSELVDKLAQLSADNYQLRAERAALMRRVAGLDKLLTDACELILSVEASRIEAEAAELAEAIEDI